MDRAADVEQGFDVEHAFDAHAGELLGFATAAIGDRGAGEDAVQEVFVRAWRARDGYGPGRGSVRTWLFAIARNVVVDVHRARTRRPVLAAEDDDRRERPGGDDPAAQAVDRLAVLDALGTLSQEHRAVVLEVYLAGAGYAEVSARTGVPVATLRSRMHYALKALRRELELGGHTGPAAGTMEGRPTGRRNAQEVHRER
ncbi:sigma-70 family RNA polymerase sigma factor [Pseudokineococcus sp. 1T1Z-3]|uniref:sigma-70 family RNA polymerase sigma factor n=1 Tax=Pseudokineococcus sp. 1T1Z-3 TaxID=3132745 RepID=UPI00309EE13B